MRWGGCGSADPGRGKGRMICIDDKSIIVIIIIIASALHINLYYVEASERVSYLALVYYMKR